MLKKFKDFDVNKYINSKKLYEAFGKKTEMSDALKMPNIEDSEFSEEEVITGTAVYEDPFLLKISHIIDKKLKSANIGKFAIYHDIVYLNGNPGVWFHGLDDNTKDIVCCRNHETKEISIFNEFEIGKKCTSLMTYTTKKLGFKDLLDALVYDLQENKPVNESVIEESKRYGIGFTENHIKRFEEMSWSDKDYVYDYVRRYSKEEAAEEYYIQIQSGSEQEVEILKAFVGKKELSAGDGQTRTLIDCAYTVVNAASGAQLKGSFAKAVKDKVLDTLIDEYKSMSGGSPAISSASGVTYNVEEDDDDEAERLAKEAAKLKKEAKIEEERKKYQKELEHLSRVLNSMCIYVKNNGKVDRNTRSALLSRGVLITGKGGIGKSHAVDKALEDNSMNRDKDYISISSGSTTSADLYKLMYEYNGKLIILDDSANIFEGEYRIAMWKAALQDKVEKALVGYPGRLSKAKDIVYDVRELKGDRQKRYYVEVGRKSITERDEFKAQRMKELGLKRRNDGTVYTLDPKKSDQKNRLMKMIDREWMEKESQMKPAIPDQFIFTGLVVIITNSTRDELKSEVGDTNWMAIQDRFINFDMSPSAEAIWTVIKTKILEEFNDKSMNDDNRLIPHKMTEEFIKKVEELICVIKDPKLSWRTINKMGLALRGDIGLDYWEDSLKRELTIGEKK